MLTTAIVFICIALILLGTAAGKPLGWIAALFAVVAIGLTLLGRVHGFG